MSKYYIPANTAIDSKTWSLVQPYAADDEPLEMLDAQQMYKIVDLAPAWDCVELDYYEALCEMIGVDYDAYDDIEELMEAVADKLGADLTSCDSTTDYGEGFNAHCR